MFSTYQWLLTIVIIGCIGYLIVYGSSSTSVKEIVQRNKEGLTPKAPAPNVLDCSPAVISTCCVPPPPPPPPPPKKG